jgi:WD40 repeat protein
MIMDGTYLFNSDVSNLKVIGRLRSHKRLIHAVKFSPDGKYIASGDDVGILVVYSY